MAKQDDSKSEGKPSANAGDNYAVLARKYRPSNFDELIGQDAMVRTLRNAFASGRIAQAYMLTGVRGVGKTTTARILARALNYEAPGVDGPTIEMKDEGEHCAAIMESRHVDVLEMDAASHTGIDDIREIIESVRYKPVAARMKVFIIDEVHMLSRAAFNGLLKTLEEPPEHVRFIFATTEIRKVPVTVLSRCQRFDLRRVEVEPLKEHFAGIAKQEKAKIDDEALTLIARAAEGSVRDGLSLLDQVISHAKGEVKGEDVRAMLGLADRGRVFELFDVIFKGDAKAALASLRAMYEDGAEPLQILSDLAESIHVVTRIAAAGKDAADPTLSEAEKASAEDLAGKLDVGSLSTAWQVLLKGIDETNAAPRPLAAAEMVLVRLAYLGGLPSPEELARIAKGADAGAPAQGNGQARQASSPPTGGGGGHSTAQAAPLAVEQSEPAVDADSETRAELVTFEDVIALVDEKRERKLAHALENFVRLVRYAPRSIEVTLLDGAPHGLPNELRTKLTEWTGEQWMVAVSEGVGEETIAERRRAREVEEKAAKQAEIDDLKDHPAVKELFATFPDAQITDIRELSGDDEDDQS